MFDCCESARPAGCPDQSGQISEVPASAQPSTGLGAGAIWLGQLSLGVRCSQPAACSRRPDLIRREVRTCRSYGHHLVWLSLRLRQRGLIRPQCPPRGCCSGGSRSRGPGRAHTRRFEPGREVIETASVYPACGELLASFPWPPRDMDGSGTIRSMVLVLRDADDPRFFVVAQGCREGGPLYSLCRWPAGDVPDVGPGGRAVPGALADGVIRSVPPLPHGSIFGCAESAQVEKRPGPELYIGRRVLLAASDRLRRRPRSSRCSQVSGTAAARPAPTGRNGPAGSAWTVPGHD